MPMWEITVTVINVVDVDVGTSTTREFLRVLLDTLGLVASYLNTLCGGFRLAVYFIRWRCWHDFDGSLLFYSRKLSNVFWRFYVSCFCQKKYTLKCCVYRDLHISIRLPWHCGRCRILLEEFSRCWKHVRFIRIVPLWPRARHLVLGASFRWYRLTHCN